MFRTLRARLMVSYLFLLGVALLVITGAVVVFFSTRPAPSEATYARLAAVIQGLNIRDILRDFSPPMPLRNNNNNQNNQPDYDRISGILSEFATTRNVRVMWLTMVNQRQFVVYDSAQVYPTQTQIIMDNREFFSNILEQTLYPSARQIYGSFNDPDKSEWLFGGITRDFNTLRNDVNVTLLIAEERPTVTLNAALGAFASSVLPPLLQAGIVGMGVAFVLAYWMTRNIAQPLQNVVRGAQAIAKGHYDQRVPERGVQEVQILARTFNEMAHEVHATQQAQRDFLANVSHDLKTPLTSIQGFSQAILDGAAKDPTKAAKIIYDEASRMTRMVEELTDLIRMQSGALSLKVVSLRVDTIAQAVGERLSVVADKKWVSLQVDIQPTPPINADGDRIAQVLTNLLSNAIKFTPSRGTVWLKTRSHQGGVEISVSDSGIGIPAKDLPRIFERFYQVDKVRGPQRGTGLGLAIVNEIVQAHGGTIRAESAGENQGATFIVWLPLPDQTTLITRRTS